MQSRRKQIHTLLEEMLKCAEAKDKKEVLRINKSLEPLILKEQKDYRGSRGLAYDTCRQSCILPFTLLSDLPELYNKMIDDARKKLSKIKSIY